MLSQRTKVISTWVACDVLDDFDATRDELVTAIRELGEERSELNSRIEEHACIYDDLKQAAAPHGDTPLQAIQNLCEELSNLRGAMEAQADCVNGLKADTERLRAALVQAQEAFDLPNSSYSCVERAAIAAIDAALASPAPPDSEPDVDAATGCADDQSGLGAAVALLGRERVDQIMSGADSAPGTDWRKLCVTLADAYQQEDAEAQILDSAHAEYEIRDAVRREREKEGKAS